MAMRSSMTAVAAIALSGLLTAGTPARAGDDCDTVVKALEEALSITAKNFDTIMAEVKKLMSEPADDKKKASVKNTFCSASGELLGTSRATRAVAGECGANQHAALASLDKSINEMEAAIDSTCK